jgi:hypothetical protein
MTVSELAQAALERDLITSSTKDAIDGLVVMHTLALLEEGGRRLDVGKAIEFITFTEAVLYTIKQSSGA